MIAIDPGHGGKNHGCTGNGLVEKDLTLCLGRLVFRYAKASGLPTGLLRGADIHMSISVRGQAAHDVGATQVVSLHFDTNPNSSVGQTTFYVRPGDETSRRLAAAISSHLPALLAKHAKTITTSADDWRRRAHNVLTAHGAVPALLMECAFLSNPVQTMYLRSPNGLDAIARAIVSGLNDAATTKK